MFCFKSEANDSTSFFSFNREQIQALNSQNLFDLMQHTPFIHRFVSENESFVNGGILSDQQIAIYKNGFPLLMDQNVTYSLQNIPLWDIDEVTISISEFNTINKNNGGLTIHMYSSDTFIAPYSIKTSVTSGSLNDIHSSITADLSNVKHNLSIGGNRSFESSYTNDTSKRHSPWAASERYDLDLRYQYHILSSVQLNLYSDNSWIEKQIKGDVIAGTSRAKDQVKKYQKNSHYGILKSALSKNHSLSLLGQFTSLSHKDLIYNKDLSNLNEMVSDENENLDTLSYNNTFMQLNLNGNYRHYGFDVGIELSNTNDKVYSSINGIKTAYSDYSAYGLFHYQYKNGFKVEAGSKFLTNSLSGSYLLPQARIILAPSKILQLNVSYNRSISYPNFQNIFYPDRITEVTNNILLEPTILSSYNFHLDIKKNHYSFKSGLLYTQQAGIPVVSEGAYINSRVSGGSATYFSFTYKKNENLIRPSFILHGLNFSKDSINQNFFYPELNFYSQTTIPKLDFKVFLTARFLGKYSDMRFEEGKVVIQEIQNTPQLHIAIRKDLMKDRFAVLFGVNNILDNSSLEANTFELTEFSKILLSNSNVLSSRKRNIFLTLKINLL
ncbi:MAG: hypothetical protein KJP21_06000 [Bacteroidia bacterium]|nr:hypothetical protein [Bacteroidia bacterium]